MNTEIEPLPNPHDHFAIFSVNENQSAGERGLELRRELFRLAGVVRPQIDVGVVEFNLEEELEELKRNISNNVDPETLPVYNYAVSAELLELALVACELVKQDLENQRVSDLGE